MREVITSLPTRADRARLLVWVPFNLGLPDHMQDVLVCNANTQRFFGEATYRSGTFLDRLGNVLRMEDATHWMLSPRLPKPYREIRRPQNCCR